MVKSLPLSSNVKLTPLERRAAVLAARTLGLSIAGVDMLRCERGPLVMSVNSTPELEAIEGATRVDVAGAIAEFVEKALQPQGELEPAHV